MRRSLTTFSAWLACMAVAAAALGQESRRRALVIGLNRSYANVEGVGKLNHAENDAEAVAAVLESQGWEKPVPVLIGNAALRSSILSAFVGLARESGPQDTVLIYFAGHGVSARWAEGKMPHTYWIAADTTLGRLDIDGLRLEHVMDYVDDIPARKKVVILDHCHSGTVTLPAPGGGAGRGPDGEGTLKLVRDLSLPNDLPQQLEDRVSEGLVVLGAASDAAYEFTTLQHGLFTHVLLQALTTDVADKPTAGNGDGELSSEELADYLEKEMAKLAPEHNVTQTPLTVVGGNRREFDITTLTQTPDEEKAKLLETLGKLAANELKQPTEQACTLSVQAWADARRRGVEPSQRDLQIVKRLQGLQDQGAGVNWAYEAGKMPGFVAGLP